jgi:hypothetical protein
MDESLMKQNDFEIKSVCRKLGITRRESLSISRYLATRSRDVEASLFY